MNTLELLKQIEQTVADAAALDEQIQERDRVAGLLGVSAVVGSDSSLDTLTVHELEKREDEDAKEILYRLLGLTGADIKDSFGTEQVPEPAPTTESSDAEQAHGDSQKPTEAAKLREFYIDMVQNVTDKTYDEAAEAASTLAGLVSTVVHGIAKSEKYQSRVVKQQQKPLAETSTRNGFSFAAMRVNMAVAPDTLVHKAHNRDGQQTIHIETFLRGIEDPGSCVVVNLIGDKQPEVYRRIYKGRKIIEQKVEDDEEAERLTLATIATVGMAYENYRPENDKAAEEAAKRLNLII